MPTRIRQYVDQVPYLEVTLPYIAWLELASESEYTEKLKSEIILSNSPERSDKKHGTTTGWNNYVKELGRSMEQLAGVIKKDRWVSIWFCSQNENAWRAISDNLKLSGLGDSSHQLVIRKLKTFKVNIEKEGNPLAKILEQDLLIHSRKNGNVVQPRTIPSNTTTDTFLRIAVPGNKSKGLCNHGRNLPCFREGDAG